LVLGFKDKGKKFHPTQRKLASTRANPKLHDSSLEVGIQGSQIAKNIAKQAKDFATKKTREQLERLLDTKERQERELQTRRDFEKRLVSSFKRARDLQIKDPVLLKNQILIDVPEIKDTKENIKFIEKILNGFIKREKSRDKAIKNAKTKEDKDRIQSQFDVAEGKEEADVKKSLSKDAEKLKKKNQEELERRRIKDKAQNESQEEIGKKAVDVFKKEEEEKEKTEKEALLAKEEADKEIVTFADLEKTSKDESKIASAFKDLLKIQSEAKEKQDIDDKQGEDTEDARVVAETLVGEIETSFPAEIVSGGN